MKIRYVLIGLVFLGMYGLVGTMDVEEEKRQQNHYCEMVGIWDDSNGEYGWPPYDGREGCQ